MLALSETWETNPTLRLSGLQPFLDLNNPLFSVDIHPVSHLSVHTFFYCFASASFVQGLMPDRVSPVSITPHLLPLPTQPQLHPISPLSARLPAGKHKTLRLHLFSKSRDAPGRAEGGPPRRTVVSRPPWPWPQSSPQTGIKSEQTEYFPKLLYRRVR